MNTRLPVRNSISSVLKELELFSVKTLHSEYRETQADWAATPKLALKSKENLQAIYQLGTTKKVDSKTPFSREKNPCYSPFLSGKFCYLLTSVSERVSADSLFYFLGEGFPAEMARKIGSGNYSDQLVFIFNWKPSDFVLNHFPCSVFE